MKRTLTILIITALCAPNLFAQALLVVPGDDDAATIKFNPDFVRRNRITSIVGEQMLKRDNEPMRSKRSSYYYRFDEQGRTVYSNSAFGQPGSGRDTASITFTFDPEGRVIQRMRNDLGGHFAYSIDHDSDGRPIRETYSRIENLGTDRYNVIPGKTTEISDEQFRYEVPSDTVVKKVFLNSVGLPFREQRTAKDEYGYLRSIEDVYLISNKRSRTTFRYDEKGRLAERIEQPDTAWPHYRKRTWRYDNIGNVVQATLWHNEKQMEVEEYLYQEGPLLLSAKITKDIPTGQIHVVKYMTQQR